MTRSIMRVTLSSASRPQKVRNRRQAEIVGMPQWSASIASFYIGIGACIEKKFRDWLTTTDNGPVKRRLPVLVIEGVDVRRAVF
jgi:hypothetical protein